jgi:hypothetical protein
MNLKRLFLAISVLLTMSSCVETIVMDPHEEMPAVVYCVLTNKSDVQTLDLSAAESPAGVNPEIKAKEVIVHSSSGGYINFEHVEGARWMARFRPREGAEYSLRVVLENGEELTAETVFPDSVMVNDYYADREHPDHRFYNPYHEPHHDYMDELYFADRLFDQRAHYLSPEILGYNYYNQTRSFGFKLLDSSRGPFEPHYNEMRWGTNRLVEEVGEPIEEWRPYQKACVLWVTARSPQQPEEFALDALYVPGHAYRSLYLATDMAGVDHFNAIQLTLGDLACYSVDNCERVERSLVERDKELIPAFYEYWFGKWYDPVNMGVRDSFYGLLPYSDLPLHANFLRLVFPEGGYINQYSLTDPTQRYDEDGNAYWLTPSIREIPAAFGSPSPFTFHVFADFNLDDPYTWQWTTHNLATGWVVYEFHHVSEEYDAFLRTLYKAGYSDVFGDLTETLYSREGVYSNIKGGVGIFGAECVTVSLR